MGFDVTNYCSQCEETARKSEPVVIDTIRILVDWKCNLACSYCCNEQAPIRAGIKPTKLDDIDFSYYQNVCISGGEPLLFLSRVEAICQRAAGKTIILYTNGTLLTPETAAFLQHWGVQYVNIGLHNPKSFTKLIQLAEFSFAGTNIKVRFHAQDKYADWLLPSYPLLDFRFWEMDDCDRGNEERVVLVG